MLEGSDRRKGELIVWQVPSPVPAGSSSSVLMLLCPQHTVCSRPWDSGFQPESPGRSKTSSLRTDPVPPKHVVRLFMGMIMIMGMVYYT